PAIGAAGIETERGQPPLDFLDLGTGWPALAARKGLHERLAAHHAMAEMTDGERVIHRWVVSVHRIAIGTDQEFRTAGNRHPALGARGRDAVRLAVGAHHTGLSPIGIRACAGWLRPFHLVAPGLAAAIAPALDQVAAGACERVIWPAERI